MCPLTLFSLRNPISNGTTGSFDIQVLDQDYVSMILESGSAVTLKAISGSLSSVKIVPDNYRTRA